QHPWGREQWERRAEGNTFDGMESWLPWLTSDEHLLPDLLPPSALVAIIEPRRLRDRAQELLDEEAALARTLAITWGAQIDDADTPRLSLPFDRLLAHTGAQPVPVLPTQQVALVAEADLTGRRRVHRRARGARKGLDHYEGLTAGDYVVHRVHGVGRYHGMETKEMFGITRDRLVVEFKGGDRVYVD